MRRAPRANRTSVAIGETGAKERSPVVHLQPNWDGGLIRFRPFHSVKSGFRQAATTRAARLTECTRVPQRLFLRDLRLEAHRHAVLFPDERVAREAERVLADIAGRLAIEEEVRLALEPEAAPAIDRNGLDLRTRSRGLSKEDLFERPAELAHEHRDAELFRLRYAGVLAIGERDALARPARLDEDVIGRAEFGRHADGEVHTTPCLVQGDALPGQR